MARSTARLEILLSSQWRIKVGFSPPWLSDSSAVLQAVSTSLASPGPPHWEQSHRITECSRLDRTSGGLLNHLPSFGASHLALLCFTWASEQQGYICTNMYCTHTFLFACTHTVLATNEGPILRQELMTWSKCYSQHQQIHFRIDHQCSPVQSHVHLGKKAFCIACAGMHPNIWIVWISYELSGYINAISS